MSRRRRAREPVFGFDSFLDIVANVVGIIIRLILVAWVGARSYQYVIKLHRPAAAPDPEPVETRSWEPPSGPVPLPLPADPDCRQLASAQEQLLAQLQRLQQAQAGREDVERQLTALAPRRQELDRQLAALEQVPAPAPAALAVSLAELRQRQDKLTAAIRDLEQSPIQTRVLRYHAPISKPVGAEEVFFECINGRVTFIELPTMLDEVQERLREKGELLKSTWQVTDVTAPAGAFRLRYTVERARGRYEDRGSLVGPQDQSSYSYGVTAWEVDPVVPVRGESLGEALTPGSTFRRIVTALQGQPTVATFWVYPDSFELFRRLRDFLYDKDITVAGRPLLPGYPIRASIHGTRSRGQ